MAHVRQDPHAPFMTRVGARQCGWTSDMKGLAVEAGACGTKGAAYGYALGTF